MAVPFEIAQRDGVHVGSNGAINVTLLDDDGRMFRRRAVKGIGGGAPRAVEWLVVELSGVRVYVDGVNVIVTMDDLTP
jgi:hypothetical protein